MLNGLVYKLLYRHISVWQMAGFTLANLCGMTIVVAAIQFAADVLPLFSGNDSFMRPGQIVITKRVNYFSSLSGILRRGDKGHQGTVLHQKRGTVPSITIQGLCHHWQQRHGNGVFHTDVF